MKELEDVEAKLDFSYQSRRKEKEKKAIEKINKNPNYFYYYAKRFFKTSNAIGNLIIKDGTLVTGPYEKAEVLRKKYDTVASQPKSEYIVTNPSHCFDCQDAGYESLEEEETDLEMEQLSHLASDVPEKSLQNTPGELEDGEHEVGLEWEGNPEQEKDATAEEMSLL